MSVLNSPFAQQYYREVSPKADKAITSTNKRCSCGMFLSHHNKCLGCGCLVGEGHETISTENGLCWSCRKYRRKK